jgi:adenosine deaminase
MLTNTCELSRAQQEELKRQAIRQSLLPQKVKQSYLAKVRNKISDFTGYIQSLRQLDSSFKGETAMPKAQDYRLMGLY